MLGQPHEPLLLGPRGETRVQNYSPICSILQAPSSQIRGRSAFVLDRWLLSGLGYTTPHSYLSALGNVSSSTVFDVAVFGALLRSELDRQSLNQVAGAVKWEEKSDGVEESV
jgi:hypothetical protein